MMSRRTLVITLTILATLSCSLLWAANTFDPISQGDFAVLLASNMKAPAPAGGWTPSSATAFLSGLNLTPLSGTWSPAETLKDGNLVHILRQMGQPYYSVEPDSPVTWGKAYEVMGKFADFFKVYLVNGRTGSNDSTTHVYTGMGNSAAGAPAPASPSRP